MNYWKQSECKDKLKQINRNWGKSNMKCRHLNCEECHGTGRKKNGTQCLHMLYCNCPRCVRYTL